MSDNLSVRRAEVSDVPALVELNGFVQEFHRSREPAVYKHLDAAEVAVWFTTQLDADGVRTWVATAGCVPIGYVSVLVGPRDEHLFCHARAWWEIDQICVRPDWRRKGVARALLRVVAEDAARAGADRVLVSSHSFNTGAQETWRHLGFEPQSTCFRVDPQRLRE